MVYYIVSGLFLTFFWCPCMAINVSAQYNGGLLPDIILLTQCYFHRGTRLNAMKSFCICSLWSHLNVLTFPPPNWGMLRRSRCVLIFSLNNSTQRFFSREKQQPSPGKFSLLVLFITWSVWKNLCTSKPSELLGLATNTLNTRNDNVSLLA